MFHNKKMATFILDPDIKRAVAESAALARSDEKKEDAELYGSTDTEPSFDAFALKEEDYPETDVPDDQRESLDIAQHWTLQLLEEFNFFWEQLKPFSFFGGGATFEDLKTQLESTDSSVILSSEKAFAPKKKEENVRLKFAELLRHVEKNVNSEKMFDLSFDRDLKNWLFLYPVPTAKQFKAIQQMEIGSQVLQPPPIKPKRISFEPSPLPGPVPENYIHQRVVAESFFAPPEPEAPEPETVFSTGKRMPTKNYQFLTRMNVKRKELKQKYGKSRDFILLYDEELEALEKKVRAEGAASAEEVEAKVESAWQEMWHTPCTRETLWNMLNEAVTFVPYYSSKETNLYYTQSKAFEMINTQYTILSSGFAVTETLDKLSVYEQLSENKFPCFNKTVIENKFDIVWLLLDLRIQEMYTCSNAFRFLLQVSTDCQEKFLTVEEQRYIAVPPIASKKSVLKKTVKSKPKVSQKWVLTNCSSINRVIKKTDKKTAFDLTFKPILLKNLDSDENNYLFNTVPTSSFFPAVPVEEFRAYENVEEKFDFNPEYVSIAITQFQNFTDSHDKAFDAIFVGTEEVCDGSTDNLLSYYETEKDSDKFQNHFKKYILMLKPGGLFGLLGTKESLVYSIGLQVLKLFKFDIKEPVKKGNYMFVWAVKPSTALGGGETLQWTPEEYFTYMFQLKPEIQDIYKGEKQTTTKMLGLLKQGNVDTTQWETRLEALFQELLGALTVQQVNEAVSKIRNVEHALVQVGKTELEGGSEEELSQTLPQPEEELELSQTLPQLQPEEELELSQTPSYIQPFVAFDTDREMLFTTKRQRIETPPELLHAFRQLRGGATAVNSHVFSDAQKHLRRLQKNQLKLSF